MKLNEDAFARAFGQCDKKHQAWAAAAIKAYHNAQDEIRAAQPKKIRNIKTKELFTLEEWQVHNGHLLTTYSMRQWIKRHELCPQLVAELIEEFCIEMVSKNKTYANFAAAFKVYLLKGYLSKKINQVKLAQSPYKDQSATIFTRGVSL